MTVGLPVVASGRGALPEVVGDAGILVDPEDVRALSKALEQVLSDVERRRGMSERGLVRAERSHGPECADALRRVSCGASAPEPDLKVPLRIGIDARELLGEVTGVGRYLGELLIRWTRRPDAETRRFILYSPGRCSFRCHPDVEPRVIPGGTGTWWEQTDASAGRSDGPARFFAPAYTAPLALGIPFAVTIHDVSFIAHPEWFRPRERWRRRFWRAGWPVGVR